MLVNRKLFIQFYPFYFNNKLKQVQLIKFYSSYVGNVSSIIPTITYFNSDLKKDKAIKQNKSEIYRWTNVVNNKNYIGSSINLSRRFKEYYNYNHISNAKRSFPIHSALLKYGYSSFKLEVLEYCDKSNIIEREQYYMSLLNPEYNVLTIAGSNLGFKHSEATKELFRSSRLGRKREKILKSSGSSAAELTPSDNKKRVFLEATKLKLSAKNYKSIAVILRNTGTGIIRKFPCKNKAAQFLGVSETTVRNFIKQQRVCKGYTISRE